MYEPNDPDTVDRMRDMFGPGQVDQAIRQAIQSCWMMLPKDQKTIDELEKQIRRIFERALKAVREDADAFGVGK